MTKTGTSTYGAFFKPHQIERGSPMRPTGQYQANNVPFDGENGYTYHKSND